MARLCTLAACACDVGKPPLPACPTLRKSGPCWQIDTIRETARALRDEAECHDAKDPYRATYEQAAAMLEAFAETY